MGLAHRAALILFIAAVAGPIQIRAEEIRSNINADTPLYLSVFINGQPKNIITEFIRDGTGRFRSKANELIEIGIDPGPANVADTWVFLDTLQNVKYSYDQDRQEIRFLLDPSRTTLRKYNLRGSQDAVPLTVPSYGAVVNYSLSGQAATPSSEFYPSFTGASAALDGRAFSPYGTVSQSGLVSSATANSSAQFLRLNTTWSISDPDRQLTYAAGDVTSGGLSWTRPIRLGGVQIHRNFSTRPDLITFPLPSVDGTAAVPSSVDVYLGKLRLTSLDVDSGRFQLDNLPVPNADGDLRIVVKDATGTLHEETLPFGASSNLLRKGLLDFSLDAGAARTGFATSADAYDDHLVALASSRYGLTDKITVEGHAEAGAGLANLGAGVVLGTAGFGTFDAAIAGSTYGSHDGLQLAAGYTYSSGPFSFNLEARHLFGDYLDLADATAVGGPFWGAPDQILSYERLQVSKRLWDGVSSISGGYAHIENRNATERHLINAAFNYRLSSSSQFTLTGQTELGEAFNASISAGMSFVLGGGNSAYTGASYGSNGYSLDTYFAKPMQQIPGSLGYAVNLQQTEVGTSGNLMLSHYGKQTQSTAIVNGYGNDFNFYGSVEGSAAFIGGETYLARHIDDSFAVVDVGAPGVTVYDENREVGKTDKSGKLLVPGIRSFEANKLSIEPKDLPVDSTISETSKLVSLPERSGTVIKFSGTAPSGTSAIVVFRNSKGEFPLPGSTVRLQGSKAAAVVGYDGETFLTNLGAQNVVEVKNGDTTCHATFTFQRTSSSQPRIGPVDCF